MRKKLAGVLALVTLLCGCQGRNGEQTESTAALTDVSAAEVTTAAAVSETTAAADTSVTSAEAAARGAVTDETAPLVQDDQQTEYARDVIRKNNCIVGAAFVGYIDSQLDEDGIRTYLESSETFGAYGYLNAADLVLHEGAELYAFTPLEEYSVTVYPAELTEEGEIAADRNTPLYKGKAGESIVLRCNLSEIYSNVLISVANGSETVEFQPMLSMMDGSMITADRCWDLTIYGDTWDDFVSSAYESLLSNFEIRDYTGLRMALQCTNQIIDLGDGCQGLVFVLGTDRGDQFVNEKYYAFGIENGLKYYLDPMTGEWELLPEG